MHRKTIVTAVAGVILTWGSASRATSFNGLTRFLDKQLTAVETALNQTPDAVAQDNGWDVRNMYLRLQASVGFSIPVAVDVSLVPQIELVFHKK